MYKIIKFQKEYRDDMIFCFLSAKDALGKVPKLREELLDVEKNYLEKGEMFWLAVDDNNRVIGMVGTDTKTETDLWLKRLFIKPEMKRKGVAGALLAAVEEYARGKGVTVIHTCFREDSVEAPLFYTAKGFVEAERFDRLIHLEKRITTA